MLFDWRKMPSLAALRAFDATARHGGFAGAARSLNVTHAAIAQHVRALEAEFGTALATRQGRHVQLTAEGEQLARALSHGFGEIFSAVDATRSNALARGLRVTTTPFLTERLIMPRLADFWASHPGAEISLFPTRDFVDILTDRFDLAIRAMMDSSVRDWPGTERVEIARVTLIAIAAPQMLADRSSDAQSLPWLWHDGMEPKINLMRSCGLAIDGIDWVRIGSANLLLEAVRQGMGVTLFNESIAREEIAAGGLVQVKLPEKAEMSYYGVFPKGPKHPLLLPFTEWVKTLF